MKSYEGNDWYPQRGESTPVLCTGQTPTEQNFKCWLSAESGDSCPRTTVIINEWQRRECEFWRGFFRKEELRKQWKPLPTCDDLAAVCPLFPATKAKLKVLVGMPCALMPHWIVVEVYVCRVLRCWGGKATLKWITHWNGSHTEMGHTEMDHTLNCVTLKWIIHWIGSHTEMGHTEMGHTLKWVTHWNGLHTDGSHTELGHTLKWVTECARRRGCYEPVLI